MLNNILEGRWPAGEQIPSERDLIGQFGVSRIAIREALSMLRGLGILDVGHGRRTKVRSLGSESLGQLMPLLLLNDGQKTFDQVFEIRLALESASAYAAATRRSEEQLARLQKLARSFSDQIYNHKERCFDTDKEFHLEIARATGNPLFPTLLEALGGFVSFAQRESCRNDIARAERAAQSHESIADAIADADANRAKVEMEAHLRFSMTRKLSAKETL